MKKLIAFTLLAFPFVAWSADCPKPEDCYTDRVSFEILDSQGKVVDRTVYERNIPLPYAEAMALKYLRARRIIMGGADTFLKVISAGSGKQALQADMAP